MDTAFEVIEDLAKHLNEKGWIAWTQIPLGSVMWNNSRIPRADVLAVNKSFSNSTFIIYEVKVSRSDFLSDVNRGKYLSYLDFCSQLYFAAPSGLLKKEEIPENCGLIVRGASSWRVAKAATRRDFTPTTEFLLKLLMVDYKNRLETWKQYERIKNLEYKGLKDASQKHGIKIARDLESADEVIQNARELTDRVGEAMGVKYDTLWNGIYSLKGDVERLLGQRKYAKEVVELTDLTMRLFHGSIHITNAPGMLRKVADRLEEKHSAEVKEDE